MFASDDADEAQKRAAIGFIAKPIEKLLTENALGYWQFAYDNSGTLITSCSEGDEDYYRTTLKKWGMAYQEKGPHADPHEEWPGDNKDQFTYLIDPLQPGFLQKLVDITVETRLARTREAVMQAVLKEREAYEDSHKIFDDAKAIVETQCLPALKEACTRQVEQELFSSPSKIKTKTASR